MRLVKLLNVSIGKLEETTCLISWPPCRCTRARWRSTYFRLIALRNQNGKFPGQSIGRGGLIV
jgi:hypothetical protein